MAAGVARRELALLSQPPGGPPEGGSGSGSGSGTGPPNPLGSMMGGGGGGGCEVQASGWVCVRAFTVSGPTQRVGLTGNKGAEQYLSTACATRCRPGSNKLWVQAVFSP